MTSVPIRALLGALLPVLLGACSGQIPDSIGSTMPGLAPCPPTPNCVSSDAEDDHRIAPLELVASPEDAWKAAREAVAGMPRTKIITASEDYLHAEFRSALFRFVDDLELQLRPDRGMIAVRAASRVGRSDLGVNRRRVERLRSLLQQRGTVR